MIFLKHVRNDYFIALAVIIVNAVSALPASAHARWVVPSHTVVSGDKPMAISLDYSISNAIFHPDIAMGGKLLTPSSENDGNSGNPMAALMNKTRATVVNPNGETQILNSINQGRKTSTYFMVRDAGTYRVEIEQAAIDVTLFKTREGESQRLFGQYEAVKSKLPEGATAIESLQFINRIQTFVTFNQITTQNLAPSASGLELKHTTHPNELFAGEKSRYQLQLDGKAVNNSKNSHIKITKSGTRFRNQRETIEPVLSEKGQFEVTWPEAGLYLVEVEHEVEQLSNKVVYALFLTIEIHPE